MANDIIARGMASNAAKAAQDALNELAQVVEGTMNAEETQFTDSDGNVVTPDTDTVYLDTSDYVYYRWNGSAYYTVSDPRNVLKYTEQTLTDSEKAQARANIGAQEILEASAEGKVLVSNASRKFVEADKVSAAETADTADNLVAPAITNDTMYSSGPTGGLADISTGEEAYLQEIKGMSIVWNQLQDGTITNYTNMIDGLPHVTAIYEPTVQQWYFWTSSSSISNLPSTSKIYDLTVMFGGTYKIPFTFTTETEYPANGTMPAQTVTAVQRFQRLFANVDLLNAPYDAGTIKNVKVTKLVETGRNLWNTDWNNTSTYLQLLAGYQYEVYRGTTGGNVIYISYDNGSTWTTTQPTAYARADGKYVRIFKPEKNALIKGTNLGPLSYVGFVHSGNYCLTTGLTTAPDYYDCTTHVASIPAYHKYEFDISGLSENGLNGLKSNSTTGSTFEVYDTKDYTRVGSIDLSTLHDYMTWDSEYGWALDTTHIPNYMEALESGTSIGELGCLLTQQYMTFDGDPAEHILYLNNGDSTDKPTGTMLYPLETPVATGQPAFEPIPLKSGDTWVVDDMGSEYFIQPTNTNCPVNQVAYYYENLKDKLVNLQEPIEVSQGQWSVSNSPLQAIKIGSTTYNVVVQGNIGTSTYSISIGNQSSATNFGGVAIGYQATARTSYCTAYGYSAWAEKTNGIALGYNAHNYIPNSFAFDHLDGGRTLHVVNSNNIFFRNELGSAAKDTFAKHKLGHYLSEYIQNNELVLESGKYYISYTDANNFKTFSNNRISGTDTDITSTVKGVHLVIKLSNDNIASLDLLPYDTTNSKHFTAYGIASDTPTFVSAYIDADGCVVLTLPADITAAEVLYTLK